MNIAYFVGWWNWLFLAPFALGVLLVALSVFGLGDDDGDADSDGDVDGEDEGGWLGLPSMAGVQRFALWWGVVGWSASRMLENGQSSLLISVPIALIGGAALTAATKRALGKIAPQSGTTALHEGLEGRVGEAAASITSISGAALIRDEHGTLHRIAARAQDELEEAIVSGEPVLVVAYDEASRSYRVRRWDKGLQAQRKYLHGA